MAFSISEKVLNESAEEALVASIATAAITIAAGALVVVWVKYEGASTTVTVTDGTTTATAGTQRSHANGDVHGQFHYYINHAGGSKTFTAQFAANRGWGRIHVWEISTGGATAEFASQATAQGSSTAPNSGSFTTSTANGIAFGGYGEYSNATVSSETIGGAARDDVQGTATIARSWAEVLSGTLNGAAAATLSASEAWVCCGIAFQEASGGGGANHTVKMVLLGGN